MTTETRADEDCATVVAALVARGVEAADAETLVQWIGTSDFAGEEDEAWFRRALAGDQAAVDEARSFADHIRSLLTGL